MGGLKVANLRALFISPYSSLADVVQMLPKHIFMVKSF